MTNTRKPDSTTEKNQIPEEAVLKVSKEVAIKFIEMGRITPATFEENFKNIHGTIKETVNKG